MNLRATEIDEAVTENSRHRRLPRFWYLTLLAGSVLAISLSAYQMFSVGSWLTDADTLGGVPVWISRALGFKLKLLGLH